MSAEIDEIVSRWEKYLEQYHPEQVPESTPVYEPTPLTAGPKAITIEEYKRRTVRKKDQYQQIITKKKKRAGKKFQKKKKLAILYYELTIADTTEKKINLKRKIKKTKLT